jgi:hypothetical protein
MGCEPRSAFIRIKSVSYILASQEMWRFPSEARLDFSRSSRIVGHVTYEDKMTTVHTTNSVKVVTFFSHNLFLLIDIKINNLIGLFLKITGYHILKLFEELKS